MSAAIRQFVNSVPDKRVALQLNGALDRMLPTNKDIDIVAHAGGGQADATVLRSDASFHDVITVATAADSVVLPSPKSGDFHFVKNSAAANAMQVYAVTPGTIDSVATGTGVSQLAGDAVLYFCLTDGNYLRLGGVQATEAFTTLSATTISMNDGGYVDFSSAALAAAGSGQSTYAVIADQINAITGADGTKGVALPAASAGRAVFVINTSQTLTLPVAPINAGNDQINSLTAGTGVFTMGPARAAWFIPTSATQWYVTGDAAIVGTPTEQDMDGLTATAAEINRTCDISTRVVTTTATALSLTVTEHADRVVLINTNSTVANTFTLPVATGSGAKFTLINNIAQTQGTVVIAANGTLDTLKGVAIIGDTTAETAGAFVTTATSDKLSMDLTTTGGLGGDQVELLDGAANVWTVRATLTGSGTLATPFSAT